MPASSKIQGLAGLPLPCQPKKEWPFRKKRVTRLLKKSKKGLKSSALPFSRRNFLITDKLLLGSSARNWYK